MKRMIVLSMVGVVSLTAYALAQQAGDTPKPQAATTQAQGPTASPQGMMMRCMGMMQKAGMDPAMMKRMQVMMQTPIYIDSPSAICGQAAALNLSDEQKARLVEIGNEARKMALAVLTPEQKKKLGGIPQKPMAMMQMCTKMMPAMQKRMGSKGGPMMMKKMMGGKGRPMMKMRGGAAGEPSGSTTKPAK